jgi:hypothetical protein
VRDTVAMTAQAIELPPVAGQHRNRALASARRTRAIELKLQGLTYQQIADALGYASRGTVYRLIQEAQAARLGDAADDHRRLELARLDALQMALWPRAMDGDVAAAETVRRLIDSRCRLLGLVGARRSSTPRCAQPQTVVLQADDCRRRGCPDHT